MSRHGTRLDQADKTWRDTAEHPYDPPLSYGGWIQCQTLGARIDKELQSPFEQSNDDSEGENGEGSPRPRKKRKIIIHSSPYKRCIQTSIAIAAGLKYPQPEKLRPLPTPFQRSSISKLRGPPEPPRSQPVAEGSEKGEQEDKLMLKVDPWLSEWLSPSYFEDSKIPPPINVIVDRARDTLTRPIQEIRGADLNAFLPVPESPDDDRDADKENEFRQTMHEKGGLRAMAAAGHSLPHRTRTTSFGFDRVNGSMQFKPRQRAKTTSVYSPPVPQYSLAPQDPIPAGFVAHARDGCVKPDLEWDSEKMGWGDAGIYPEEWGTMHVRFRLGLQKMLSYYESLPDIDESSDEDEDIVVVLVTHQAGANALIRLVTGAPALHDVGVASLTLAVRRPVLRRLPSLAGTSHSPLGYDRDSRRNTRRGSLDLGLADDFEMRIIASTEHLRYGSNPLGLNSPRLRQSPAMSGRRMVGADSLEGFSIGDPLSWRPGSSSGLGRNTSQRGRNSDSPVMPMINTGLWGSPALPAVATDSAKEPIEDLTPMSPLSRPTTPSVVEKDETSDIKMSSPARSRSSTLQSAGLWGSNNSGGSPRSASGEGMWGVTSQVRARSPAKRRWTAVSIDAPSSP